MTGLPCCWISKTPPGIFWAAISLRIMSASRFSPSGEIVPAAGARDSARSSPAQPAARENTSAATARQRTAIFSVRQRFIDEQLERALDALTLRRRLLQQHEEHLLLGINHHVAAAGAVPFQLTERSRRRRLGVAGIGAHGKPQPHAKSVAG